MNSCLGCGDKTPNVRLVKGGPVPCCRTCDSIAEGYFDLWGGGNDDCERQLEALYVRYHGKLLRALGYDMAEEPESLTIRAEKQITLDELIQFGRDNGASMGASSKDQEKLVPWSFYYEGRHVSHENDDCYIVGDMHFHRGEVLCTSGACSWIARTTPTGLASRKSVLPPEGEG